MSGGVNVKSALQAPAPSGIPLPLSLLPSSPRATKHHRGSMPLTQTPKQRPRHTPTHSPASCPRRASVHTPSSKDPRKDGGVKFHVLQRKGDLSSPQVSRSACSSPQTQCRGLPRHSKDTLDLGKKSLAHTPAHFPHDGNYNRTTFSNKNQVWGTSNLHSPPQLKRGANSNLMCQEVGNNTSRKEKPREYQHQTESSMLNNSNLCPTETQTSCDFTTRDCTGSASQSDEEMGTPEDRSPVPFPSHLSMSLIPAITKLAVNLEDQNQQKEAEFTGTHTPRVNMATVAPFCYKSQVNETDFSADDLSDCSSGSIEVCCDDLSLGRMLEANVANISMTAKPRELDLRSPGVSSQDSSAKAMASRKQPTKPSGLSQGPQRPSGPELKVYRPGSGSIPIPIPNSSKLRKQRSMSNLSVLTDAEKKLNLYQSPRWNDDTSQPAAGANKAGQSKTGQSGSGRQSLSRTLSKSEQSLFQGKPKPFCTPAVTSNAGKPSRIPAPGKPRSPYAEVKPISKASEMGQSAGMEPGGDQPKANSNGAGSTGTNGKRPGEKARSVSLSSEHKQEEKAVEGDDDKAFLKVDPELVVTVLGDLEQLLFSQVLDPESQRKRTVQNVMDLRQNLEETMTSLRGVQLSHSYVEATMCYDSDEAAAFSISSLSNRSSPLSWRHGQASPRLQAGDAPSMAGTQSDVPLRMSHASHIHLIEDLDDTDPSLLKGDYLSDSDLGGKSPDEDDEDDVDIDDLGNGWDESSSISSGLSDGSDNMSSEEFNTSPTLNSLPTTPIGSRRNSAIVMRTDAEKRSLVENGLSWDSEDTKPSRKSLGGSVYDTGSLKSESANKWKKTRPQVEGLEGGKGELKKPQTLGQGNALKKGRNPPVGITSPITHTSQSGLKVACVMKSDGKPVDKSRLAVKNSGLQRSSSDAGKEHRNGTGSCEQRKPPSGLVRPSTGGNFGYKKPTTATCNSTNSPNGPTVMSTGGSCIPSSSTNVGKGIKMSGIPVKPGAGGGGRKTSLDVSGSDQSGFLSPNARTSLQYRSLPRPAKTSTLTLTRPSSARPVSSTMDTSSGLIKPSTTVPQNSRLREQTPGMGLNKTGSRGIPSPSPVNQTDREKEKERAKAKAVASDSESAGVSLKGGPALTPTENGGKLLGLRPPSSSKSTDLPSPNTHRLSGVRSLTKPPSIAQLDKLNSNSLDVGVQDLPPKIPPFSKLQDLASSAGSSASPCLTPSPAPLLNVNSSACFSGGSGTGLGPRQVSSLGVERSAGSTSPLLYPRLSGLHRSMESLSFQMSLAPELQEREKEREDSVLSYIANEPGDKDRQEERRTAGSRNSASKVSVTATDSSQRDRNTLPKKGLSCTSQVEDEEKEKGERRHSHTIISMTDSLTLPMLSLPTSLPRSSKNSTVPSPVSGPPRMTRSNSIPAHDASLELYGASPLGSTLSLAERPRSMVRSGSFRDKDSNDEVHGSVISLASNASSSYSSVSVSGMQTKAEERIQGEQIRKLRRELESSQEKVSNLTTQLTANANLVAAFEQSLALMTTRLQSLSVSHEQKDTELLELRETIEALRARNEEAQAVIQGALNNPDNTKELRIRRQNSCESISSLNSLTSMSSVGSLKDQDAKKKKKKSWLRSSFNKAFSIKKGSKTYSDIEEIATPDSSAPNSPKIPHEGGDVGENPPACLRDSLSATSVIMEAAEVVDSEERAVSDLRSELWVKERELTDIRLEALNSAHQLEQLRDAMNNMQSTVENLKAENDHLKVGSQLHLPSSGPTSSTSQPLGLASFSGPSLRQPMSMSLTKSFSLSLNECKDEAISPVDTISVSSLRDEVCAQVLVRNRDQAEDGKQQNDHYLGSVLVGARADWASLDSTIAKTFRDYLTQVDPTASLGLSCDSLHMYQLPQGGQRVMGGDKPQFSPHQCLGSGPARIFVTLKGLKEQCVDSWVFETLIPKPMMLHYISLLLKHRRLVLSGPSGTGKTYLAQHLARYLLQRSQSDSCDAEPCLSGCSNAVTFNMHRQSQKELQLYLSDLANQIDRESGGELPLVVIIDDISDAGAITELVNGALTCKYHKCPYIIGTTNQPMKMSSNNGLHLSFRMVMFSNNVEPANGFLLRYLHRKVVEAYEKEEHDAAGHQALLCVLDWVPQLWYHLHTFLEKHSTSDFLIGPCFFLSCPVSVAEFRQWFIDLWNHSIIPYLQEGAKDGIKVHGQKAVWEDPVEWVRGTLPWPNAQQDQSRLFHLPPPSVGPQSEEKKPPKDTPPPSALESDPLMAMLLKLQESANCIDSPEREGIDPTLQAAL